MRDLIKPTLFIVARLGLFLAVMAWIVGQWCLLEYQAPLFGQSTVGKMDRNGFCAQSLPRPGAGSTYTNYLRIATHESTAKKWQDYRKTLSEDVQRYIADKEAELTAELDRKRAEDVTLQVPGIQVWNGATSTQSGIAVRHWLVFAIFTAFNILLHFIYRKRPEVQPCEN